MNQYHYIKPPTNPRFRWIYLGPIYGRIQIVVIDRITDRQTKWNLCVN